MGGSEFLIPSADFCNNENDQGTYSVEFLNSLQPRGMPPHLLKLKRGMIVMLLRNVSIKDGLTNGCRLSVVDVINSRILVAKVLSGKSKGMQITLPRTNL